MSVDASSDMVRRVKQVLPETARKSRPLLSFKLEFKTVLENRLNSMSCLISTFGGPLYRSIPGAYDLILRYASTANRRG